ncbi:adenylate/guanylate cyclase domain-containing protein [Labrenzia sp. 011]|uniref:CHASE2 domain-containing protein n=1 Tax=Labrenzia sp. 011 TaxID=2171494 RepID=UPI000D50C9A6|nr:adenylate/guanylate cyclase domain-containing protein [Labrenzia sp. 011]PVB61103.1 adenylate/guanylate cyclase domain-containing protein [Labrenzia sp. 011]
MKSRLPTRLALVALLVGCLWAGWLVHTHLAGVASVLDRAETVLLDLRILLNGPREVSDEVVIVAIDDETVSATGSYPLGHDNLARLVDRIRQAGARALAIDILLTGTVPEGSDGPLAAALGSIPAVVAAAGQFSGSRAGGSYIPKPDRVLSPLPAFTGQAATGLVNVSADAGGTPRHIPLVFVTRDGPVPSFVLSATGRFLGRDPTLTRDAIRLRNRLQPLDYAWHLPLNYYGPSGTVRTVSAQSVYDGSVGASMLDGRLVLVGATATGVGDRFSTPFDPILPGVEVLATGVANLLDGSGLVRNGTVRRIDAIVAVSIMLIALVMVIFLPLAQATILYLLLVGVWLVVTTLAYGQGYWFNGALPVAASLPPLVMIAIVREIFDRRQTSRFAVANEALSRFQAPGLARRIAEDPGFLLRPVEQDVAILFIDLAGYTGLTERLGPGGARDVLKSFHTLVVNETARRHGVVLDFMGDGAMICFGIPEARQRDAADACLCAFDLVAAVQDWIASSDLGGDLSGVRIGGHYGPVVLSRLGHETQQQIAATGDCVNVASRLMETGKGFQASVALSTALVAEADRCMLVPPRVEAVAIRGRRQSIHIALWTASQANALRSGAFRHEGPAAASDVAGIPFP